MRKRENEDNVKTIIFLKRANIFYLYAGVPEWPNGIAGVNNFFYCAYPSLGV
jgi:hypothetical protein